MHLVGRLSWKPHHILLHSRNDDENNRTKTCRQRKRRMYEIQEAKIDRHPRQIE